ncbi:MAG: hypothetical protein EBQ80_01165, partial [Proteobacteria bacterium]|nr:hypothetical protein [Pseudomonadota bacterium]
MAAEVAPEATPQGPTDFLTPALQASKPTANPLKRKVGQTAALPPAKPAASTSAPTTPKAATASNTPSPEKKSNTAQATPQSKPRRTTTPRNFAAATVASPESKSSARMALEGTLAMASNVPIDTRPLHRVDEELIASGILAAPKGDSLTSQVPVGVAESESFMNFAAEPEPTPFKTPAPIAEAPKPAPMAEAPKPSPIAEASKPVSTAEKKPVAESLKPIIPPTITPLPPVQSNLPWVPAPQAAEGETTGNSWDVPAPAAASSSIAAAPTTPATSTPPADFFKPILTTQAPTGTSTTPPWSQMQGKAGFPPPELPGARNRNALQKGGTSGMLWGAGALAAAVIALVVWNHQQANITLPQQINQIANLGQTQTTQSDTTNSTGATGFSAVDFKSSLTPPIATNSVDSFPPAQPPEQSNSTAQIAFTDVPPEQATGPIVA